MSPSQRNKVHFIGIGGIGTSALARWFLSYKYIVSGSDASYSEIISGLEKQGVKVFIGHQAKNLPKDAKLVVYSAAVPSTNPEILKAKKLGILVKSYAEVLGELSRKYKTFAVAGAHGKSTTTALLSLVLIKAGFDPAVIIGTKLKEFGNSNFRPACRRGRRGKSDYLILEADEYNGSFLNYSPFAAIILNIDREHLDYYKNLSEIKKTFLKFISNIRPNGILILNKDDKNLSGLKGKIQKIAKKNKLRLYWYGFGINRNLSSRLAASLKISGNHNVSNALAVYALAKTLGVKDKNIFSVLGRYRGAWRRMEYKGKLKIKGLKPKVNVYDDYGHHPSEIKATLSGIAQKWPKTGLICVFEPHQAKRLSLLFKDFTRAFDSANYLVLLPIYQVQGRDKKTQADDSEKLAKAVIKRKTGPKTIYLPHSKKLKQVLTDLIIRDSRHQDFIVVMMGAGDIYKLTDKLIK